MDDKSGSAMGARGGMDKQRLRFNCREESGGYGPCCLYGRKGRQLNLQGRDKAYHRRPTLDVDGYSRGIDPGK